MSSVVLAAEAKTAQCMSGREHGLCITAAQWKMRGRVCPFVLTKRAVRAKRLGGAARERRECPLPSLLTYEMETKVLNRQTQGRLCP